jgi:Fic family protein
MKQLSQRQSLIYNFIRSQDQVSNHDIKVYLSELYGDISRLTVIRDVDVLLKDQFVKKVGAGRSTRYQDYNDSKLLKFYDSTHYFKIEPDNRSINTQFNFSVFDSFTMIFSTSELKILSELTRRYQNNINQIAPDIYRKEIERLTIELSWKSSQIEGNTYSLLDTEILIKDNIEAKGHDKKEAIMILNHKQALDYIFNDPTQYGDLSIRKIEDIHRLLVNDLSINTGLRHAAVSITGTSYRPLDNQHQIKEALEKTIRCINAYDDPFHKSLVVLALLSYIQPFSDGNKRCARVISNAILNAYQTCPLSYRSIDPVDYKKAMVLFYEQNSLLYLKELFIKQYEFSTMNYFLVR